MTDSKWLPMIDAPKDGTPILLVAEIGTNGRGILVGAWSGMEGADDWVPVPIPGMKCDLQSIRASWWMPLPAIPTE